ncbi:MAG: AgmX/PglI C-terminal domain-containing protein [Oligoflexia bacterium]|nr:AgmX/PglI C-terminal domain-containing protein [Oligoflexia bacterium]
MPKVLRIGVLHGGKVVQERLVRPGADVTIGESPRNTFVVSGKGVPKRYTLFVARGSRYQLAFTADMDGKVALDQGVATFKDLRAKPATHKKGGAWSIALSEQSRGKISLGELTVLFQFVPAPPESARLIGATDFRPKLIDDDDPVFLGFLALFSAMAAVLMVYVFNTEPVDLVKPGEIPDRFVDMIINDTPPKEAEEAPPPLESEDGNIVQKEVEPEEAKPKERRSEPKTEAEKQAAAAAAAAKKREDTIQSSKLLMGLIGTRGENNSGRMVEDLLGEQDNKFGSLQNALQNVDGAAVASESSIQANKGATDGRGAGDASIGDMARAGTGNGAGVADGPGTKVSGRVTNDLDLSDVEGGEAAGKTIKRYKGQVQNCYEGELKLNPNLRGRLAVVINVVGGAVRSVEVEDNGTGSKAIGDCVKSRIRRWHFDAEVTGPVYSTFVLEPSG